jgi:ABC-type branched-subunit amino acid transport system substrate-binding protein
LSALALTACGGKGRDADGGAASPGTTGGGAAAVKTGPGVTATTISLGALTDLSGVFAPLTSVLTHADQAYWKQRNAQGGVCGRQVKLVVKDDGYDVQKAVVQYRDLAPQVAALQQLVGSPITTALLPSLKSDSMLAILASWPSSLLSQDVVIETGATYELELINGLGYLKDKGLVKSGDSIGSLYFEGEYGEAGLKGVQAFAQANGMKVVEQKIQPTDEDMSGPVAAFKKAGVKVVAATTAPTQFASLAGIAASQGMDVPVLGNNPTFDPSLLKTPSAAALKAHAYVMGPVAPLSSSSPEVGDVAKTMATAYPKDTPKGISVLGFAQGRVMYDILAKACQNRDLSREGIVKAARQLSNIDTDGLLAAPLDYTKVGQPSARAAFIGRPADVKGGIKQLGGVLESAQAKSFDTGG